MSESTHLIKLESGEPTMSSREIADLVEARHNDVVATIDRLFEKGLLRSDRKTRQEATGGRPIEVYDLIERDCYLVVAGYSDEVRARVIDRWQELEKQVAAPRELTRLELLQIAMDSEQKRIAAESALAIAAPKAEFVDRYVEAETGSMGFRQVAKLLGVKENAFKAFLIEHRVMYRLAGVMTPYAEHLDAGRFEVKTGVAHEHAYQTSKFTAKGVQWIADKWRAVA